MGAGADRRQRRLGASRGAGVTIAIVDTGIDFDHEDLVGKTIRGITFTNCGDSGCGDGGWRTGAGDPHPHGTHVAGIAGAATGNRVGIAGVAPDAQLLAVKVLTDDGGRMLDLARGIRYSVDAGAQVINLSLAWPVGIGQTLQLTGNLGPVRDAIRYAHNRGVVVIASAGNDGAPTCNEPADQPGVLCVTATTQSGARAGYANRPMKPLSNEVGVAAPGGAASSSCGADVVSTVTPRWGHQKCAAYPANLAYREFAGTSMAAPHVSGIAALLVSVGCTRTETVEALTSTASGGSSTSHGHGIVDASAALAAAPSICAAYAPPGGGSTPDRPDRNDGQTDPEPRQPDTADPDPPATTPADDGPEPTDATTPDDEPEASPSPTSPEATPPATTDPRDGDPLTGAEATTPTETDELTIGQDDAGRTTTGAAVIAGILLIVAAMFVAGPLVRQWQEFRNPPPDGAG